MTSKHFFFAGGGTGGHIYPALAVAQKIRSLAPQAKIHFLCSERPIDTRILSETAFDFTCLPAQGFTLHPARVLRFIKTFWASYQQAKALVSENLPAMVIGAGGFVSAPVCYAAHRLGSPLALINVDSVPGKANVLAKRWAHEVFTHFHDTTKAFGRYKAEVHVVGCPLRPAFDEPRPDRAKEQLTLDPDKKILLITGASSGCKSINEALAQLLPKLAAYRDTWQIVHLTGTHNFETVNQTLKIKNQKYTLLPYYDNMADLLACADLVIGRCGAVSVAEYAVSGVPSICIPYPHHRDRHQYRNAGKLVEAGAAVMIDDLPDLTDRSEWLWEELEPLLKDDNLRQNMARACADIAKPDAAREIASYLINNGQWKTVNC
jgi:UDP-N-acetylglucosamine--N-acetylmuramyl-(pentapeptide) pyrophosphoryl-undecaprenol N-acetylglucosamine transferase